jgi:hypothetical protein
VTDTASRLHLPRSARGRLFLALAVLAAALGAGLLQGRAAAVRPAPAVRNALASVSGASGAPLVGLGPEAASPGEAAQQQAVEATGAAGSAGSAASAGLAAPAPAPASAPTVTGATSGSDPAAPQLEPQIARTGAVELTVTKARVGATLTAVGAVAARYSGRVADSKTDESGDSPSGMLTLRLPSAKTDRAIADLRELGTVHSVTTSSEDVTGQVVDTGARLTALQASRETYLTILGRATTIGDTLSVQQRLDRVQQEIEQLQGSQKALSARTAESTLTVTVSTRAAKPESSVASHPRTGLALAWDDAKRNFGDGVEGLVAASGTAGFLLALLVVIGLAVLAGRRWYGGRTRSVT